MQKTLIAATLLAALGGFVASGAAYADDFNGVGQHPRESVQASGSASSASTVAPSTPNQLMLSPSGGAFDPSDVSIKSHGHT